MLLVVVWASLVQIKDLPASAGNAGSIPGLGWYPRIGNGNPLQYSCLKISQTEVPGKLQSVGLQRVRHDWVTKQQQISNLPFMLMSSIPLYEYTSACLFILWLRGIWVVPAWSSYELSQYKQRIMCFFFLPSFGYIARNGIVVLCGAMFDFIRKYHTVFQSVCVSLSPRPVHDSASCFVFSLALVILRFCGGFCSCF